MNNLNDKYYLVHNQKDLFYLFELEPTGNLIYKTFDKNANLIDKYTVSSNNVINFNLTLDSSNRINLIYLLKSGELFLTINDGLSWSESLIGSLDTKSNKYHQFELLYINNKINIIYSFSNYINSEIISIHHLILDNKIQDQNNVIKYILRKGYNEFSVGFDEMGTIHLLYNTTTNFESYIYHSFYSPYKGSWSTNPKELSTRGKTNSNPYLFIDSKSNVHTAWLEMENSRYRLKYAKMPVNGKNKYIWQDINISIPIKNKFTPIIYEFDGVLKMLCYDNDSIKNINSNDFGVKWSNVNSKDISNAGKFIGFAKSKNIHPEINAENVLIKNSIINELNDLYLDSCLSNETHKENIVMTTSTNLNSDGKFQDVEENLEVEPSDQSSIQIQMEVDEIKSLLNQVLKNQESIINEINYIKNIKVEKPSLLYKLFKSN
ncbi:MAG: hypothetical protein RIN55_04280 [Tissierellaceae bacterium]|nr:hypothetical protein [Tissierellaceae bacterium]